MVADFFLHGECPWLSCKIAACASSWITIPDVHRINIHSTLFCEDFSLRWTSALRLYFPMLVLYTFDLTACTTDMQLLCLHLFSKLFLSLPFPPPQFDFIAVFVPIFFSLIFNLCTEMFQSEWPWEKVICILFFCSEQCLISGQTLTPVFSHQLKTAFKNNRQNPCTQ